MSVERRPIVDRRGWSLLAAVALIAWLARSIIGPFVVAAVIAYAFSPLVSAVERRTGLARLAVVAIGYVVALGLIGVLVFVLGHRLVEELGTLATRGPDSLALTLRDFLGGDQIAIGGQIITTEQIAQQLQDGLAGALGSPMNALHLAAQIGGLLLNSILALIVTFYFLLDGDRMRDFGLRLVDPSSVAGWPGCSSAFMRSSASGCAANCC